MEWGDIVPQVIKECFLELKDIHFQIERAHRALSKIN